MTVQLLCILIVLAGLSVVLIAVMLLRSGKKPVADLSGRLDMLEKNLDRMERYFRDDMAVNREDIGRSLRDFNESVLRRMSESASVQKDQLDIFSGQLSQLTGHNVQKLDKIVETVDRHLKTLQEDNSRKLEQMRATVDEKLHNTLERRLGESFKLVSDRLEMVHKGLGEMQSLASGVGDLKKVLTNIKMRGTFGEIQLHTLLEQILSPDQYECNIATKRESAMRVEFAVRLPGRIGDGENPTWLPIDAKFPQEDYLRLLDARESGDLPGIDEASRQLERVIREMAKNIRDKYLDPPCTTDFGLMFLPTEGLYAEILRRPGLFELLQRDYKVVITGPTTLAALLNSLQMGFRTLAVEKRSSEVWTLLGMVKTEFASFGAILDKTQKKLQEASNSIERAAVRSRSIEKKLRNVQDIPANASPDCLETEPDDRPDGQVHGIGTP